jgi:hypothetical protein
MIITATLSAVATVAILMMKRENVFCLPEAIRDAMKSEMLKTVIIS